MQNGRPPIFWLHLTHVTCVWHDCVADRESMAFGGHFLPGKRKEKRKHFFFSSRLDLMCPKEIVGVGELGESEGSLFFLVKAGHSCAWECLQNGAQSILNEPSPEDENSSQNCALFYFLEQKNRECHSEYVTASWHFVYTVILVLSIFTL